MFKWLKRCKVLHPLTGLLTVLVGAASYNGVIICFGVGVLILCLIKG